MAGPLKSMALPLISNGDKKEGFSSSFKNFTKVKSNWARRLLSFGRMFILI